MRMSLWQCKPCSCFGGAWGEGLSEVGQHGCPMMGLCSHDEVAAVRVTPSSEIVGKVGVLVGDDPFKQIHRVLVSFDSFDTPEIVGTAIAHQQ